MGCGKSSAVVLPGKPFYVFQADVQALNSIGEITCWVLTSDWFSSWSVANASTCILCGIASCCHVDGWMCGVKLNERKKSEELRELSGLEPVSLLIKKNRLRWFGHVERKDDNDWVKRCITWEVEGIRQRGRPKKTWWDCVKNVMTWKV